MTGSRTIELAAIPPAPAAAPAPVAPAPIWVAAMAPSRVASMAIDPVAAPAPPDAPRAPTAAGPSAVAKAPVAAKAPVRESRRPYHLGVAIGLSAGVYATSLAAVTILQIDQDKRLAADRQPVGDAISMLGYHNDRLAAGLADASSVFDEASQRYGSVVDDIGELHVAVKKLGKVIGRIEGTSTDFQLPGLIRLPSVPNSASNSTSSKPASKPAAKPPPSNGGTGASGKP